MIEVGDKVRTHKSWNSRREPIEGIVMGRVTEKSHKWISHACQNGFIGFGFLNGQCESLELILLDNGTKIHESNLEKVEYRRA